MAIKNSVFVRDYLYFYTVGRMTTDFIRILPVERKKD